MLHERVMSLEIRKKDRYTVIILTRICNLFRIEAQLSFQCACLPQLGPGFESWTAKPKPCPPWSEESQEDNSMNNTQNMLIQKWLCK